MPRPRKGPHIYRRPGRVGLYAYIDREHKHISLGTDDDAEGLTKLAELLNRGGLRALAEGRVPLATIFDEYRSRSKTNHTKKSHYENDLNLGRVLLWLEERNIITAAAITPSTIEDYKTARRFAQVSAARINRELTSWRQAMKVAVEDGEAPRSILDAFKRMRETRPLPHRPGLTKREIDRFLAAEDVAGYRALFRTALGTGMRDDELRHMDETDIRPPKIVITPKDDWTTKGYRYRSVPVSKATIKAARTFLKSRDEINLDQKAVWKRIQRARKAAGIKKHFSMHDLRRAFASHLLAAGFRLEQIQKWLGHRDLTTTMRYLMVVDEAPVDTSKLPF